MSNVRPLLGLGNDGRDASLVTVTPRYTNVYTGWGWDEESGKRTMPRRTRQSQKFDTPTPEALDTSFQHDQLKETVSTLRSPSFEPPPKQQLQGTPDCLSEMSSCTNKEAGSSLAGVVYDNDAEADPPKRHKMKVRLRVHTKQRQCADEDIEEVMTYQDIDGSSAAAKGPEEKHRDDACGPASFESAYGSKQTAELSSCDLFQHDGRLFISQNRNCRSSLWRRLQFCKVCRAKKNLEMCNFIRLRAFPVVVFDDKVLLADDAESQAIFKDCREDQDPALPTHNDLSRPMDEHSRRTLMKTCASELSKTLEVAVRHAKQAQVVHRKWDHDTRTTCDFCMTGIFISSYFCRKCGQEYCLDCYSSMVECTSHEDLQSKRSAYFKCLPQSTHEIDDLLPMTRATVSRLEHEIEAMRDMMSTFATSSTRQNEESKTQVGADSPSRAPPKRRLATVREQELNEALFLEIWHRGEPIRVEGVDASALWNPAYFRKHHGRVKCAVVCGDKDPNKSRDKAKRQSSGKRSSQSVTKEKIVTVGEYFAAFGQSKTARRRDWGDEDWKLKDWPSSSEFRTTFPSLYAEFNRIVPMPDYTRRDGCHNLSSLFPKNTIVPDLGPKMYIAWPGEHKEGGLGTTRLHMDVADAVNILLYASEPSNDTNDTDCVSGALWHIFRAQDANAIRDFLRSDCGASLEEDPIHSQKFYLDERMIERLYKERGVHAWQFIQRTGEAVFIPAGCAHQVCNLTDCIKIAVDFLSPQNIAQCTNVTAEFRGLSGADQKSWKDDLLQLRSQLWYAWIACRQLTPLAIGFERRVSVETEELERGNESDASRRREAEEDYCPRKMKSQRTG